MGQYYKPVSIDKMEYLDAWDWDQGAKLMESSYIGNYYVTAIERLLSPKGRWYRTHICWAGDYMDSKLFLPPETPEKDSEGYVINLYTYLKANGKNILSGVDNINKNDDYDENQKKLEQLTDRFIKTLPAKGHFLTNHTKKVYINLKAEKGNGYEKWGNGKDVIIHPLPLLVCSGNGQGGGDYEGNHMDLVGSWAGDEISIEYKEIEQYTKLNPCNFIEGGKDEWVIETDNSKENEIVDEIVL